MDLVVEVVQQGNDPPELLVLAEVACVPPHRRFDRERVTQQRFALRVLRQCLPGALASSFHMRG